MNRAGPSASHPGWSTVVLAAAAVLLASCGKWLPRGMTALHPTANATHATTTAGPAAIPAGDTDMVGAVASSRSDGLVQVRFALRRRPEVGAPAELDVELVPVTQLDRLVATFHAEDGLTVRTGGDPTEIDRPEPGVPIAHPIEIIAQRDGLFYVHTTVLTDAGADSIARTFTIPVIAGSGSP